MPAPTFYLRDNLYSHIKTNLSKNTKMILAGVAKFIDKNSENLFCTGIQKGIYFKQEDVNLLLNATDYTEDEVKKIAKGNKLVNSTWKTLNDPFNLISFFAIRYAFLEEPKNEKLLKSLIMYLAVRHYAIRVNVQFPYTPNPNIMNYTINNLSNKFKLKQTGNIFLALEDTVMVSHATYKDNLKQGCDEDFKTYISGMITRIANFVKNIAGEYYKNHEKRNFINTETETYDDDNYNITENESSNIEKFATAATVEFCTKGIDTRIAKIASNLTETTFNDIMKAVNNLRDLSTDEVKEFYKSLLRLYLTESGHSEHEIRSTGFLVYFMDIYIKSNTKDDSIIKIKDLLNKWLMENSEKYVRTNRMATKNSFRKAIYIYMILILQKSIR